MPFPAYQGPASFRTSLEEAEMRCFNMLVTLTNSMSGRNCWIGRSYQPIDSWNFQFTVPVPTDYHLLGEPVMPVLSYTATATATFKNRHETQRWLMDVINGLPFNQFGNVTEFQVDQVGPIEYVEVSPPNEDRVWGAWRINVSFIVIFLTGGRDFNESSSESSSDSDLSQTP